MVTVHSVDFVLASDLFEGFSDLLDQVAETDPPFTWGTNNRSMVTIRDILRHMDNVDIEYDDRFCEICENIGLEIYVDLEN